MSIIVAYSALVCCVAAKSTCVLRTDSNCESLLVLLTERLRAATAELFQLWPLPAQSCVVDHISLGGLLFSLEYLKYRTTDRSKQVIEVWIV